MINFKRAASLILASSLIVVSPGLSSYSAVAAEIEGGAPKGIPQIPAVKTGLDAGVNLPGSGITGVPGAEIPGLNAELPVLPVAPELAAPGAANVQRPLPEAGAPEAGTPQAGTPGSEAAALGKLGETLQPQIDAAASADNADPRSTGETIQRLLEGRASGATGEVLTPAEIPNPYGLYAHALPAAVEAARKLGKAPEQVHFHQATISVPGVNGDSWKFEFYLTEKDAKTKPATGDIVYVDFQKAGLATYGPTFKVSDDPHLDAYLQRYLAGQTKFKTPASFAPAYAAPRVSVYKNAPLAADWVPFTNNPDYFKTGSQSSAQGALEAGRAQGLKGGVSVSFKMIEAPVSGDKDFFYTFHDDKGDIYRANGRVNEAAFIKKGPARAEEDPIGRLQRYEGRGKGFGVAAGIAAAAAIWHFGAKDYGDTDFSFKMHLLTMLASPAAMLLAAVGLTKLGGEIGAWLSGVKSPKAEKSAKVVEAPVVVPVYKEVIERPAVAFKPLTREQQGRLAGEWAGSLLTAAAAIAAYMYSTPLIAAFGVGAILVAASVPFLGLALVLGGASLGAAIGRSSWRPGLFAQGAMGAAGAFAVAAAASALAGVTIFQALMTLSLIQLAAAAIVSKIAPKLSRTLLVSGGLTAASFAALAGYLFVAFAGTIKDKANAAVFPMHDGPAPLYAKAAAAAMTAAERKGYKADSLYLAAMEARDPMDTQKGWTVQFIAKKSADATKGEIINAYLYPGRTDGSWSASAYAYGETELGETKLLKFMLDIKRAAAKNLGDALTKAAKALKVEPAELGLSVQPWRDDTMMGTDLAYVFDTVDGRRWGMNARTGKVLAFPDTGVSVARIEAAAKSVASYKGRPWSQTEYNMSEATTADSLRRDGASPAQLRLFQKLCDAAPVRGGGFNPWSGD